MLREIGVTLLVAGILTAAVLAALSGRGGLSPLPSSMAWSWYSRMLGNGSVAVYIAPDSTFDVPSLEGYSFRISIEIRPAIRYVVPLSRNGTKVVLRNVNVDVSSVAAYVLRGGDARNALLLYKVRDWDTLVRMASSKAVYRARLARVNTPWGATTYRASIPLGQGKYWVLIVATTKKLPVPLPPRPQPVAPGQPQPPGVAFGMGLGSSMEIQPVISPTPYQYLRALDIAALGAVLLGLDYHLNRQDYREGRLAALLSRLRRAKPGGRGQARR